MPGRRLDQPGQQPHQRGLAGAGEAHHHEDLAGRDVEARRRGCRRRGRSSPAAPCADSWASARADDLVGPGAEDLPEAVDVHRRRLRAGCGRVGRGRGGRGHGVVLRVAAVAGRVERACRRGGGSTGTSAAGSGRVAGDQVGGLLGDHHHRGVDVAVGDEREDRGVDDAEALDAVHPHRRRVDHGHLVDAHLRRARRVQRGLGVRARPSRGSPRRSRPTGPGESSPSLYGANAGWLRMSRATRIASTHSRRSVGGREVVELHRRVLASGRVDRIRTQPRVSAYIGPMCTW